MDAPAAPRPVPPAGLRRRGWPHCWETPEVGEEGRQRGGGRGKCWVLSQGRKNGVRFPRHPHPERKSSQRRRQNSVSPRPQTDPQEGAAGTRTCAKQADRAARVPDCNSLRGRPSRRPV